MVEHGRRKGNFQALELSGKLQQTEHNSPENASTPNFQVSEARIVPYSSKEAHLSENAGPSFDQTVNYADCLSKIEPLSCTNFHIWNNQVLAILKELDLDYVLYEEKPCARSWISEYYAERMKEHIPKLEKWQKSDWIAKVIIQWSLSLNMMRRFLCSEENRNLSAKELYNSIRAHFRKIFLYGKLINSRYDAISGLGNHIKYMFDMAYELKALGLNVSGDFMVSCLMSSLPENYNKHAQNGKFSLVCKFCKLPN